MNCHEARDNLNARLDGETVYDALDRHLRDCPACGKYATELALVARALDQLGRDTEPIVPSVTGEPLVVPTHRTLRLRGWVRTVGGIAAAIALVAGSRYYARSRALPIGATPAANRPDIGNKTVAQGKTNPLLGITLRGESASRFLAVAGAGSSDVVQVFHLYPVLVGRRPVGAP